MLSVYSQATEFHCASDEAFLMKVFGETLNASNLYASASLVAAGALHQDRRAWVGEKQRQLQQMHCKLDHSTDK